MPQFLRISRYNHIRRLGAVGGALVVSALAVSTDPLEGRPPGPRAVRSMSLPVSSSVLATIVSTDEQLTLLVLWRGEKEWHSAGPRHESGGGRNGAFTAALQYGKVQLDLQFDPAASRATVQGKTITMAAGSNVLLVDGVSGSRLDSVKALTLDAGGVTLDPRKGSLAPLLGRSPEVVSFLRCDDSDRRFSAYPCRDMATR